jgi:hypothetical protein
MSAICRFLGMLAGTAGLIGLLACVGGIIGCWSLHGELSRRLNGVFDRVDGALAEIGGDVLRARDGLRSVRRDLDAVRTSPATPAPGPSQESVGRRPTADRAMAAVGRQLGEIKPQLGRAVEIGLVANGLLEVLSDLWLAERAGIDTDRLHEASDQLTGLIGKAQKLATSIDGRAEPGMADEPSRLSQSVARIIGITEQAAERGEGVRERVAGRRMRIGRLLTALAWASTAVLLWIGLGQVSLVVHGRSMARGYRRATGLKSSSETSDRPGPR